MIEQNLALHYQRYDKQSKQTMLNIEKQYL